MVFALLFHNFFALNLLSQQTESRHSYLKRYAVQPNIAVFFNLHLGNIIIPERLLGIFCFEISLSVNKSKRSTADEEEHLMLFFLEMAFSMY